MMKKFGFLFKLIFVLGFSLGVFADNDYQDFQKVLELKKGWNLASLPIQTTISKDDIKTKFGDDFISIWKYDKGWSVFTPDLNSTTLPKNIGKIDSISSGEGFWVLTNRDKNITFAGSQYVKNYNFLKSGWNLLGAGSKIDDLNTTFKNYKIIWVYRDGNWSAYSPNSAIINTLANLNYPLLKSIDAGEGFWIFKNKIIQKSRVLLGLLGDATINTYLLSDMAASIGQTTTNDTDDIGEFNLTLPTDTVQSTWVVSEATNGMQYDTDYDTNIDTPIQNQSSLHLLSTVDDIKNGVKFTVLSQMAYTLLQNRISEYNNTYTPKEDLDYIANLWLTKDLDGDGILNYKDILHFDTNNSAHINSLKFDIDILKKRLDNNSTIYQEIFNNTLDSLEVVKLFGVDIIPPKPTVLIQATTILNIPTNSDDINETNITVSSLASKDLKVYKEQTTMLIAEDENNNTLLLGYAIPQPLQNRLLRTKGLKRASRLYRTTPSNIEISTQSTALALTMMMLQSGLTEDQKTEISSLILDNKEFKKLQLMVEVAFKVDSKFLDNLMINQDIVNQIKTTAISAWETYTKEPYHDYATQQTTLSRILKKTGANIDWGWSDDTLWYWYGEGNLYNVYGAPFLATAKNGTRLALANPTMINYITQAYSKVGKIIDTNLASRNSTMIQKTLNKGAARRIIKANPQIAYLEYNQNTLSRALNLWHISTAVLGTFSSNDMFKPINSLIENYKTTFAVGECANSLFDTVDFVTEDASSTVKGFISMNWKSLIETFTMCLVSNKDIRKYASKQLEKQLKSIPKRLVKVTAAIAAKTSNPLGWIWITAQAINGPIPIATSLIFSPRYAGYDLKWDNNKITNVTTASQPPKTPVKPIAKIKETENSLLDWSFDASSSIVDSKSTDTKYSWNIDGTIYEGIQVSHTFDSSGKKTIVLSVKDDFGQVSKKRETITVSNGAKPDISYLICTIDKDDPSTVSLSWSVSDRDNDIDAIKVYKNSSDKSPQILNSDAKEASLTYETSKIGHIYNPYIKVINDMGNEDEKSCIVSAESDYNLSNPSSSLNKGLVAWYRFEGNFYDSIRGITGVEQVASASFIDAVESKGVKFAGVDNYRVEITPWQPNSNSFTVSSFFKVDSLDDFTTSYQAPIITEQTGDFSDGFALRLIKNNDKIYVQFAIKDSSNYQYIQHELASNLFQQWNLLSATLNRENAKITLYLNGKEVVTKSLDMNSLTPQYAFIGAYDYKYARNGYPRYVTSTIGIDDLRIYNRALSEDEIKKLYQMGEPNTIIHNGVVYKTVISPYTGRVWLDRNLGANRVCQSFDDELCYGDYYQWGRGADGHEKSNSATTSIQATSVTNVGHSYFITDPNWSYSADWAQNADSDGKIRSAIWSKTDGSSICPVGFRVPTVDEIKAETIDQGVNNNIEAFNNFLRLPSAGYRPHNSGSQSGQGIWEDLWSNTADGSGSIRFHFDSNKAYFDSGARACARSIRCIKAF